MAYNYNDYNPYYDIEKVVNAKTAWNKATTDEERTTQNQIATAARKNLADNGYGDIADQLSADGADATQSRAILNKYAPVAPTSQNDTNAMLQTKNNNEVRNKTNELWGMQKDDRSMMTDKYGRLEETAYSNPFTTAEARAILGKYDLAGLQGRDNAVASGGASNGGNIDSYASANALRQQASLTNQGHMAVLEAHNNKINNARGILGDMGVYLQNQDASMMNTIGLQQSEAQRLFENDETAKNNETNRLKVQSDVTGDAPNAWIIQNDALYSKFLNPDGTFKKEMEHVDIQALINQTDDPETKKKLAVIRTAKATGNMSVYGKYLSEGDVAFMGNTKTENAKLNETAMLSEQAAVSGFTPNEWTIKNDAVYSEFLNPDGTFKKEKEGVDIQALIDQATDEETKKKLAVVRTKKILGNYNAYGQYDGTGSMAFMTPQQSEAGRQADMQDATSRAAIAADVTMNAADNATTLESIGLKAKYGTSSGGGSSSSSSGSKLTGSKATTAMKNGELNQTLIDAYNKEYRTSYTMDNPPPVYKPVKGEYTNERGYQNGKEYIVVSGARLTAEDFEKYLKDGTIQIKTDEKGKKYYAAITRVNDSYAFR